MYFKLDLFDFTRNGVFWGKCHHQSQPVWASHRLASIFPVWGGLFIGFYYLLPLIHQLIAYLLLELY